MGSSRRSTSQTRGRGGLGDQAVQHVLLLPGSLPPILRLSFSFELEDSLLEYDESESDPRLFFSNFTSGLVAINTTLLTYGALIVLGGAAIALLMYLLANSGANQRYANAYNQYGGYQGGSYSHYANRRMFDGSRSAFNFDLLGLVSKAVEVYQKMNGEED